MDEDAVHHSFNQIIAENSQNGEPPEALELQPVEREQNEQGQGMARPSEGFTCDSELQRCSC